MLKTPMTNVWAHKFRPLTIDEMILPERLKNTFKRYIEEKYIDDLLLVSTSPGTGKTSIAYILADAIGADVLKINGSDEKGIGTIRDKVKGFSQTSSVMGNKKIVFIDEADGLTIDAQLSLKSLIEDFCEYVNFIFTANDEFEFIDAMSSRFQKIYFEIDNDEYEEMVGQFTFRVINILNSMNIEFKDKVVFKVIKENFPDYRMAWQELNTIYNSYGNINKYDNNKKSAIKRIIKAIDSKDMSKIREHISNENFINYKTIYTELMRNVDDFKNYDTTDLIFTFADWNYRNHKVADKLLNFLGMCAELVRGL